MASGTNREDPTFPSECTSPPFKVNVALHFSSHLLHCAKFLVYLALLRYPVQKWYGLPASELVKTDQTKSRYYI